MATAVSGRVVCPRCGANNFDTQAACWKCGTPLTPGVASAPVSGPVLHSPTSSAPSPVLSIGNNNVDPSVANWVGILGGLLIPIVMLPVSFVFLMWDDRRKVEVGRIALIASLVGTVIHGIFTYMAVYGLVTAGLKMIPSMTGRGQAAQSEPAPDWNSSAKPLTLPGIPSLSPPQK